MTLVLGGQEGSVSAAAPSEQQPLLAERGARLLSHASPVAQPLLALLLRCNLDQQVRFFGSFGSQRPACLRLLRPILSAESPELAPQSCGDIKRGGCIVMLLSES